MPELVSIIIANYNYGHYLSQAIESALNQSYPAIEVIFIDDGSTDDSLEVACRYDITVLAQENQGVCAARNNAVHFAKGTYLFFLDADDILSPDCIAECCRAMESAGEEIGYVYGQMEYFEYKSGLFESREFSPEALAKSNYICVSSLIRKDLFDRAGGFDKGFYVGREDWELYVRFYHLGYRGRFLGKPIMRCRKHRPPPVKKKVNKNKNMAFAKLFYKYPRFFLKPFLKRPFKYLGCLMSGTIGKDVNLYGPNLDRLPRVIK